MSQGSIYKGSYCTQQGRKGMFTRWCMDRYYMTMKPVQSYYGTFEEMEDSYGVTSQEFTSVVTEIDKHEQRIAKAEKELELRERVLGDALSSSLHG